MAAHSDDDRKEADAGALFGGREEVSRHLLRGEFGTRFLPDEATTAEAVDGEFSFAEQQQVRAMKSAVAGAAVVDARDDSSGLVAAYKGAPSFGASLVAADADADWLARPTHGGPFSKRAPSGAAEAVVDRAAFGADVIMPPMLPSPPYPLEAHSYAMSGVKSLHAKRFVHAALVNALVDADFVEPESRWECVKVVQGTRTSFHIRMYRATACLALEFQRRNGCSMTYNRTVSELRSHIADALGCDALERFERSGADAVAVPAVGFAIASFDDIPDVPLGLGLDSSFVDDASDGGLLCESPEPEASAGVASLLSMAGSWSTDTQSEGIAALASLSATGEGRDMLCEAPGVPATITKALCSENVAVSGAAATTLANLSENEDMQARLVAAGCVLPTLRAAKQRHTSRDAHLKRECLRALANLTATQAESILAAGGAEAVARVMAGCDDARMRKHAARAADVLRA